MNPFFKTGFVNGFRVIETLAMVVYVGEDWSKVRSPGRARRRRKKHRQNITAIYRPSDEFIVNEQTHEIYCHPVAARMLYAAARPSP